MAIALSGIIVIQSFWIHDAIASKREELRVQTSNALNAVNDKVEEKEAMNFLKFSYGGVDSLVNEVITLHETKIDENMVISDGKEKKVEIRINGSDDQNIFINEDSMIIKTDVIHDSSMKKIHNRMVIKLEGIHEKLKDHLHWKGDVDKEMDEITEIVEHFTYERLLGGNLEDRVKSDELEEMIEEALEKEGVKSKFEFAVYDYEKNQYLEEYVSGKFDQSDDFYAKKLFPEDKSKESQYELRLQISGEDALVWSGVKPMAWLSALFTLLILSAFGYSIYFIYKQKRISRIKNDFINNMTHELKTPLASISLAASSIRHPEVLKNEDQIKEFAEIIEKEKSRMNSHIEKVLEIAAMEKEEVKLEFNKLDVQEVLNQSISNVNLNLKEVGGELRLNVTPESTEIQGDVFHLLNAFTNILDNSIKYSDEAPKIEIELFDDAKNVWIKIKDNGIGMSRKTVQHAFDKFYREESGNIHNRKGFGLGLSYVKYIIDQHQGEISLDSEKGKGTTVNIKLPKNNA